MARVLVVDDDDAQRFLIDVILQRAGHACVSAGSATEALKILMRDNAFDVIMTDVRMPEMDGVRFVKELNQHHPSIPVIMMSVHGSTDWISQAKEHGAVSFLAKPFIAPQVVAIVRAATTNPTRHWAN